MTIVLYLDFDGVVVTDRDRTSATDRDFLSRDRVSLVRSFLSQTGAKVVVTSTWRRNATCRAALINAGLLDCDFFSDWRTAIDLNTSDCDVSIRGMEIADHVSRNGIKSYLIFDDFPVLDSQADRHIQPDFQVGLMMQHIVQPLTIVRNQRATSLSAAA